MRAKLFFSVLLAFCFFTSLPLANQAAAEPVVGRFMTLPSAVFAPGQIVEVEWHNAPGNAQDWITVAPAKSSDKEWGVWTYLRRNTSGVHRVGGLTPGRYEARIYWNWPAGGYKVIERLEFQVTSVVGASEQSIGAVMGQYITLPSEVFAQGEPIEVKWHNAPGNTQDWITVAPAKSSDREWGIWTYLRGQNSGVHRVSGLAPGRYEVRIYWNWPAGGYKVIERVPFEVR